MQGSHLLQHQFGTVTNIILCNIGQCHFPFLFVTSNSVPIGSGAEFVDSGIFDESSNHPLPNNFFGDPDFFYIVDDSSPIFPWYNQGHWGQPDTNASYRTITGNLVGNIRFPADTIINNFGNNNALGILQPDNKTLFQS